VHFEKTQPVLDKHRYLHKVKWIRRLHKANGSDKVFVPLIMTCSRCYKIRLLFINAKKSIMKLKEENVNLVLPKQRTVLTLDKRWLNFIGFFVYSNRYACSWARTAEEAAAPSFTFHGQYSALPFICGFASRGFTYAWSTTMQKQTIVLLISHHQVNSNLRLRHMPMSLTSLHLITQTCYHLTSSPEQEGWVQYKIFWTYYSILL